MAFTSMMFFFFIAAVIAVYFMVPLKFRWIVLLASSYFFYFINSRYLLLLLFGQTLVTFLTAVVMENMYLRSEKYLEEQGWDRAKEKEFRAIAKLQRKKVLTVGVILVLGTLVFVKYYNFFADNINIIAIRTGFAVPSLGLLMPIGISFYTLQALSYMIDVYHGKSKADRNLFKFMLFMSYFPQIVQGPIARHRRLASQLYEGHEFDYTRMCYGLQLIVWGCFKKLVIADRIGIPVAYLFENYKNYEGIMIFIAAAFYGVQVYTDFSGGMDIARGFSQIVGIELDLNFRQPYFSASVEDFWRRWHITLGSFMKDYVFYPLSLSKAFNKIGKKSRKILGVAVGKKIPPFISMFIVYFLVGFWHGAEWKYIAYGVWNGVFIALSILLESSYTSWKEKFGVADHSFGWRLFQVIRTFCIISVGRLFSRAAGLADAIAMFRLMTSRFYDLSPILDGTLLKLGLDNPNWIFLTFMILLLMAVDMLHERGIHIRETVAAQGIVFRWGVYFTAVFAILIFGIYGPEFNAADFIYQQF